MLVLFISMSPWQSLAVLGSPPWQSPLAVHLDSPLAQSPRAVPSCSPPVQSPCAVPRAVLQSPRAVLQSCPRVVLSPSPTPTTKTRSPANHFPRKSEPAYLRVLEFISKTNEGYHDLYVKGCQVVA